MSRADPVSVVPEHTWFTRVLRPPEEFGPYHGRASVIYSELHHLRRRVYRVRVNEDTASPRIVEALGEVEQPA